VTYPQCGNQIRHAHRLAKDVHRLGAVAQAPLEQAARCLQAALDGSKEIAFTIVSMTLSLAAVFIPILFMGGIVGRLMHEFAVTIAAAILVSGLVSLTLTPMLCSRFLKPPHSIRHGRIYNAIEGIFDRWLKGYGWTLKQSIRFRAVQPFSEKTLSLIHIKSIQHVSMEPTVSF